MRKSVYWALRLLGHKLHVRIRICPDIHMSLEKRNERIVHDFQGGRPIPFLAAIHNLTENRVSQILKANGARKPKWKKMSAESRQRIFKLAKTGITKAEIGRKVGVSRERVRQILSPKRKTA